MSAVVVTICTNRKRAPPASGLLGRALPPGTALDVAEAWTQRLVPAPRDLGAAALYAGRGFREAEKAARRLSASFFVVSAGLGLVQAETPVPSYGLTLSRSDPDGVLGLIADGPAAWWAALTARSPFHGALPVDGPILAALSAPYLRLVGRSWSEWSERDRRRLRLFSKQRPSGEASALASAWMPYDDRLDDPRAGFAGTQSDFAQRALGHFVQRFGVGSATAARDAAAVERSLAGLRTPIAPERRRVADAEVVEIISRDWDAVGGRSGAMLRRLRDGLGVACEQGRFKELFKAAAARRGAGGAGLARERSSGVQAVTGQQLAFDDVLFRPAR